MSEIQNPQIPFEPTVSPAIDRANRLISLRQHPGFLEIIRLSQELVDEAVQQAINFGGWDSMQIVMLKVRMQAAQEHHNALIGKINNAIASGIAEARVSQQANLTPEEAIAQSDYIRQKALEKFSEMDSRIAGSH